MDFAYYLPKEEIIVSEKGDRAIMKRYSQPELFWALHEMWQCSPRTLWLKNETGAEQLLKGALLMISFLFVLMTFLVFTLAIQ